MSEQQTGQWIAVEDRLPEMKEVYRGGPKVANVLAFNGYYVLQACYGETFIKRKPGWKDARGCCIRVTHWMPLPDPPAIGEVKP
jgi:hypothetical protein